MILPDVNVLVYAYRRDSQDHDAYRAWLDRVVDGDEAYGMTDLVLSAFLRIVTNSQIYPNPDSIEEALDFATTVRDQPNSRRVEPGPRHWAIFTGLCRSSGVKGRLVPDAFLAALAIESGCEWISADRDYARFPGLRWRHPLESPRS